MDIPYGNIITVVITAATTLAAVVVTNWLSYRRSNRERLWELRREIYGTILSELAAVEHICNGIDEAVAERSYEEYWNTKARVHDDNNIFERMGTIRKKATDNYLVLTDEFIIAYDNFNNDMKPDDPHGDLPPEEYERFSAAIRKHRPKLLQ